MATVLDKHRPDTSLRDEAASLRQLASSAISPEIRDALTKAAAELDVIAGLTAAQDTHGPVEA